MGRALGSSSTVEAAQHAPWHPGRCAELLVGETAVGYAGELHPKVCTAFGVPARTCAAELDLDALIAAAPDITVAQPFSSFPVAKEDVALVVDTAVTSADGRGGAARRSRASCSSRCGCSTSTPGSRSVPGKKSLAYSLRFRAPDRTLTEAEIKVARDAAVAYAAERTGAVQRA